MAAVTRALVTLLLVASSAALAVDPRPAARPVAPASARKIAAPDVRFSVGGVLAVLPEALLVYYDGYLLEPASLTLTVANARGDAANCSDVLTTYFEYAKTAFGPCLAPVRRASGETYTLAAKLAVRGTEQARTYTTTFTLYDVAPKPWPLENDDGGWPPAQPNLVGNTMENYQSFSGAASAYWHQGFDIRGDALQNVYSPVDGVIVQRVRYSSSDLYWSLMIEDAQGFIWQFHHLDKDTYRVEIGDTVRAGDLLGQIVRWPSSHEGALYHHTHMNVVRPKPEWTSIPLPYVDGWQYFNPFFFLSSGNYTNKLPPTSNGIFYYLPDGGNTAIASSADAAEPVLSGAIDIVVQMASEFTPTNSLPGYPYVNGVFEIGYSVEAINTASDGLPVLPLIDMDKLPNEWSSTLPDLGAADIDALLTHVYRQSFSYSGRTYRSVFDYNDRVLYYTVTHAVRGEPNDEGAWDTAQVLPDGSPRFPNGRYLVKVYGTDNYGLRIDIEHTVTVRN
eukprot:Unigene4765_Nuclearia_a/m.14573 Unigene4765_Nuclearia_a/g.14573  ORF Unigene4765_Nuclearia_a/g.14573 Unigene4765_Nuclearia_a/m.14573 type:complete len:506 (-) Unigene4765_Nuclearia_a:42-1559(-)